MAETNELYSQTLFNKYPYTDLLLLCDGKLRCEDGCSFNIHKIALVKSSKYFYNKFRAEMEKNTDEVLIPGVSGEVLGNILSYIYTGSVRISEENVCEILEAANNLLLQELVECIKDEHMKNNLSMRNCLSLYIIALKIGQIDILRTSYRCIQTNFENVVSIDGSEVGELTLEALKEILTDKNLRVSGEMTVWMAIAKWVQTNLTHRQSQVPDLLMCLSLAEVDEQMATMIVEHSLVQLNPFCKDMVSIQKSNAIASNLEILISYIQSQAKPKLSLFNRRLPDYFHFIIHESNVYVTYDENVDLWRKLFFLDKYRSFLVFIGENIYMFYRHVSANLGDERITCYNLIDKDYRAMPQFTEHIGLNDYVVVQLNGMIYVIGGWAGSGGGEWDSETASAVEVYDPDSHLWRQISPMMPVNQFKATSVGGRIYVLGLKIIPHGRRIFMQTYCSEEDRWIEIPSPDSYRCDFKLVAYRRRLYMIGGRGPKGFYNEIENVHVFDPAEEAWYCRRDLPEAFSDSDDVDVIVLNDKLIVYDWVAIDDDLTAISAFQWDEKLKDWTVFKPLWCLDILYRHSFYTHDNGEEVNMITRKNKEPTITFEKSPFS